MTTEGLPELPAPLSWSYSSTFPLATSTFSLAIKRGDMNMAVYAKGALHRWTANDMQIVAPGPYTREEAITIMTQWALLGVLE